MSKKIRLAGNAMQFPPVCAACLRPTQESYTIMRTMYYGNRSRTLSMPVPLCDKHIHLAKTQSPAERTLQWIGAGLGFLVGALTALALFLYWANEPMTLRLAMAPIAGIGVGMALWAVIAFMLAPHLATPDIKAARNAVRINHYWPGSGVIELIFANDQFGALFASANKLK